MLTYFIIGALGGMVTGIPIGPVNIAVIETAYRHHLKRAIAVGLGGAIADTFYALVGILWFGPMVKTRPDIPPILFAASGVALVLYGVITVRSKAADPSKAISSSADPSYFWSGLGLGIVLILLNPSTLLAWVVFFGSWMADVNQAGGIAAAVGIGVGSFTWFSFVAFLAHRGKSFLQKKSAFINRVIGILLIVLGIYSMAKAGVYWLVTYTNLL